MAFMFGALNLIDRDSFLMELVYNYSDWPKLCSENVLIKFARFATSCNPGGTFLFVPFIVIKTTSNMA